MKRIAYSFLIFWNAISVFAQAGSIPIKVFIPEEGISPEAQMTLESKLNQIITSYAVSDNGMNPRFYMTADILVLSKSVVPSAPPKVVQKMEVVLYVGDVIENKLYSSLSIPLSGVGQSEEKAYINAIQRMPIRSKNIDSFMVETREKIIEYYKSNGYTIITEAERIAASGKADEALDMLLSIPDFCGEVSDAMKESVSRIYKMKIDNDGNNVLIQAKTIWESKKDVSVVNEVLDLINQINPESSAVNGGKALINQMTSYFNAQKKEEADLKDKEWEFKVRQYEDQIEIQRQELKNQATIEKARVETEKTVSGRIGKIDIQKVTRIIKSWSK